MFRNKKTFAAIVATVVVVGIGLARAQTEAGDDTKPGSISNLVSPARGTAWLYFEWENPPDKDYDGAIVHLNGKRLASLPGDYLSWKWRKRDGSTGTRTIPSYTALNLKPGTEYTLTIHTQDKSGNVNDTDVSLKVSTRPIPDRTPVRGNNVKEEGEVCDGYDLGGHAPPTLGLGFTGGTLKSKPDCSGFDTSECVVGKKIKAASSEYADVLAAVEKASVGDIVVVPEGTSTWEAPLVIRKGITLRGAGIDKTVITTSHVDAKKRYIIIQVAPPTDVYVRVTGFTFKGCQQKGLSGRGIVVSAVTRLTQFRIDHNKFMNFDTRGSHQGSSRAVICPGWLHGVVDHNQFIDCLKSVDPHGRGNPGWKRPIALGTANRVFIEDNLFLYTKRNAGGVTSSGGGGRYTFRYNIVGTAGAGKLPDPMDAHGNQMRVEGQKNLGQDDFVPGQGLHRGTVSVEIYNNKFYSENLYRFMSIRGGTGVIFNNVMNCRKKKAHAIHFWEEESFRFAHWKHHYPGWDQINNFHVWGNTNNDEPANGAVVFARDRYYIQENRDYFHRSPNRETDMHYGYKPFTYPHPMTRMTPDDN